MQHSDDDRLVTVAIGYGLAETATTVSYLEAHGVPVTTLPHHLASISWDMMVALRGMEIRVPERLGGAASVLLAESARLDVEVVAKPRWLQWLWRGVFVLLFLFANTPPPPRGMFYLNRSEVVRPHV